NLAGIDEKSGDIIRLFKPRSDTWHDHFRWSGARLAGKTAIGRTTINVLSVNRTDSVWLRKSLIAEGIEF
ncbi:MAG: restriction endonuclease, partial [Verrucomicrobiaceae bacterium]|nr:restriction endonuclease [Verrucomicrobiaceae bacterium]